MSDDPVKLHFQLIRQQLAGLQKENAPAWQEIDAALEDLHVMYEEMQSNLEAADVVETGLLQQNQYFASRYHLYYGLFQSLPIAYLVTDAEGMILDANGAVAQLLHVPQRNLIGKPLVLYVAKGDRPVFCTNLNQLAQDRGSQIWQINVCPQGGKPLATEWHVAIAYTPNGQIENLHIGIYTLSRAPQMMLQGDQSLPSLHRIPQALDGLRVLVVDDEADTRELITTVLESYGIGVRAVASATAALEALEQFQPDVLVSDIRMPDGDGYSLIQHIRNLEAAQGGHIPAAAITAYVDEDREKALMAGFEAHLHKLAQPHEWVELVTQLVSVGKRP